MAAAWSESVAARLGRNLVRCRKEAGLSQEELAARAGLTRTHVSIMEHGGRAPRIDTIIKLAVALGVDPEELLDGMRWKPVKKSKLRTRSRRALP